jgi:hypothetical protein
VKLNRILLVDLGNTRIKWAWLRADGTLGRMRAAEHASWSARDFAKELFARLPKDALVEVHIVSVAAARVRAELRKAVRATTGRVSCAASAVLLGCKTGTGIRGDLGQIGGSRCSGRESCKSRAEQCAWLTSARRSHWICLMPRVSTAAVRSCRVHSS